MDWNAEDKQAAWAFYRERLEQYFIIAGTPNEAKVTHILFYGGKEASEQWTALKDQVEGNKDDSDTVFKAFANSFEKSSSHWQARDEYLSDIKQSKHQTMAELDIYIKDLIRRCQFPQEDQESRKIDLLYNATAHFEVRLSMTIWSRWQRPMKGPAKNTRYTSKLTLWHPPVTTPIL